MSLMNFKSIIDEISEIVPGIEISPTVRGECLLHPDIVEMVKYASSKGCRVSFFTNGQLLSKEMSEKLIDAGLAGINFSFDTMDEDKFTDLHKGGKYSRLHANIMQFLSTRGNSKYPAVGANLVKGCDNTEEINSYLDKYLSILDNVSISTELDFDNNYRSKEKFQEIQYRPPCIWLWRNLYIHANGEVASCGPDIIGDRNLGNVNKSRILDIWNGHEMRQIRDDQITRNYKFCGADISWSASWGYTKIENEVETVTSPISVSYRKLNGSIASQFGIDRYAIKIRKLLLKSKIVNPENVNRIEKLYKTYLS